jgi:hypothetical protein
MSAVFINNYATTTTSALASSDTSVGVANILPGLTGDSYYLLTFFYVDNGIETNKEIVKVTAVNGNTLTIVRGQENTNSYAWPVGSRVELRVTAAPLNDFGTKKVDKDSDTGAALLPMGTTAQRPAAGRGKIRFNTDLARFECHNGTTWGSLSVNDAVFYTNDQVITESNAVAAGQNAMSIGPTIYFAPDAVITVETGAVWTII